MSRAVEVGFYNGSMAIGRRGVEVGGEAAGLARAPGGQRGALRLGFGRRGERTVLADRHASAPFGAVRANYPDGSGMPEVQITNPSDGILGGDRLEIEADLAPGSSATVLTQAANKAYGG